MTGWLCSSEWEDWREEGGVVAVLGGGVTGWLCSSEWEDWREEGGVVAVLGGGVTGWLCSSEWEDWREEGGAQTVCLFCPHKSTLPQSVIHHMKVSSASANPETTPV